MRNKLTLRIWLSRLGKYLLIPTALCIVLLPLYSILHQQTVKAQLTDTAEQLASSVSTFEGYLYDVRFITNKLFHDTSFTVLAASSDDNMLSDDANTTNALILLEDLTYNMAPVSYSFVTFARNPLVIDNCRTHHSYNSFYPNVLEYKGMTREQWISQLRSDKMTCLPVQQVHLYQTAYPDSYMTISQPFFDSHERYTGTCTVLIREKLLVNLFLPQAQWRDQCLFYIAMQDGTVLQRYNFEGETLPVLSGGDGIQDYHGEEYLFVSREISDLDAVAVIGLPASVYAETLEPINQAIWFYILAGLLGCVIMSIAMTLLDLRQLRPMIEAIGTLEKGSSRALNDLVLQKLRNHNQLSAELERTRNQMDHSRMEALLKTGSASSPAEHAHLCEMLQLTKANYLLLIPAPKEQDPEGTEELRLMLVAEQMHQCYGRLPYVHNAPDGSVLAVLTLENSGEEAYAQLCRQTENLHTQLRSKQPLILSACFTRLEQLSSVYWQARNAVAHAEPEASVFRLNAQAWLPATIPEIATLERLNEYLLAGYTENAQELIRQLFAHKDLSLQNFQQIFYSIRGILLAAAEKIACEDITFLCAYDHRQSTLKQIQNLCECCFIIGSHVDSLKQSHNVQLQRSILQWMAENYSHPDLNVAMAAEKFQISKKYVSQFLKDQTGKTFNEYLEELRLTSAMELLRNSGHSVTDIATMCGFSSQNTFYKAFRRRFGSSPSAVRKDAQY